MSATDRARERSPISGNRGCSRESLAQGFWKNVEKGAPDECWEWQGSRKPKGYGVVSVKRVSGGWVTWTASRLSYVVHHGSIPPGMHVLHSCHNSPCVNPAHLRVGTNSENQRDVVRSGKHNQASKTHCRHGHPYSGPGLSVRHNGHRVCLICKRANDRRSYANALDRAAGGADA